MSKQFKCIKSWPRHSVGDVIPESEYNRLPFEIKQHGTFQEVPVEIEQAFSEGFKAIVEPDAVTVVVSDPINPAILGTTDVTTFSETLTSDVAITVDPFADEDKPKVKHKKY